MTNIKIKIYNFLISQRWLWRRYYNHYYNSWTYEHPLAARTFAPHADLGLDFVIEDAKI